MRIALLVSGGVDSSVALHLLKDAGHDVHAFYLKVWLADEMAHLADCPWGDDLRYARAVCTGADVPLTVLSLQRAYHDHVVASALEELAAGRTPSPDIGCNRHVKFGAFFAELARIGAPFDRVASGHYARVERHDGATVLLRGIDRVKDQTYFLYHLDQHQLDRLIFPLGEHTKTEVRALARRYGLPNRDRPDSQGICFLGSVRYDAFVEASLGERRGWIREARGGERLGHHRGLWFHTIGQRRGLGLGAGPWFVVAKDLAKNELWIAHADDLATFRRARFRIEKPHWIAGERPIPDGQAKARLSVKVRHTPMAPACTVEIDGEAVEARLAKGETGLADGQPAVLYDGERCLGGGAMATGMTLDRLPLTSSSGTASSR